MACGLPCVVANIEGVTTDIIEHGVDGLLVGQDDPEGFSRAVISLLGDEALARRLGQQAMAKVDQQFTVQIISRKYSALYRELLDK
jgi:glycosyltransferase involved in cell wall biosynthesis